MYIFLLFICENKMYYYYVHSDCYGTDWQINLERKSCSTFLPTIQMFLKRENSVPAPNNQNKSMSAISPSADFLQRWRYFSTYAVEYTANYILHYKWQFFIPSDFHDNTWAYIGMTFYRRRNQKRLKAIKHVEKMRKSLRYANWRCIIDALVTDSGGGRVFSSRAKVGRIILKMG